MLDVATAFVSLDNVATCIQAMEALGILYGLRSMQGQINERKKATLGGEIERGSLDIPHITESMESGSQCVYRSLPVFFFSFSQPQQNNHGK
jgi:hypothetical protein